MTRILIIDFHDSFTYNLRDLVYRALGVLPTVMKFDDPALDTARLGEFDALILSPGPGTPDNPEDVGRVPELVRDTQLPTLGVCLGHQLLGLLSGARIERVQPRHGYLSTLRLAHANAQLVHEGQTVVRYHSLAITDLRPRIIVDARSEDGVIQAMRVVDRPWWGVQFHPESVRSSGGIELIRAWAQAARLAPHETAQPQDAICPPREPERVRLLHMEIHPPDPAAAYQVMSGHGPSFWLDGAHSDEPSWSYIGASDRVLVADADRVQLRDEHGTCLATEPPGTLAALRRHRIDTEFTEPQSAPAAALRGGWVGCIGYEARRELGFTVTRRPAEPEAIWMRASRYLAIDHSSGCAWLIAEAHPSARDWLKRTADALAAARTATRIAIDRSVLDRVRGLPAHRVADDAKYREQIDRIHEALHAGDTYEVCLTTSAAVDLALDDDEILELYIRQRESNPAPYAALLRAFDTSILSSSPERFLRVRGNQVETKPIKGTLARGTTPGEDARQRERLTTDPKIAAELLMITDLLRNDLNSVCVPGSVTTPELMRVESFATVHQLMSRITGELAPGSDAIDLLAATFPGGSMTGAPKERTMEIIDELERAPRGFYSGVLGFLSGSGDADLNVVIRTLVHHAGVLRAAAGGAVVLESTADEELAEMLLKLESALPR